MWGQFLTEVIQAQAGDASPGGGWVGMVPFILMFAVMYFLLIRPAGKQRREHQQLLNSLQKDDEVVTNGGVYGKIASLDDRVAVLEIADKVKIRILKDRIAGRWAVGGAAKK